MWSHYFVPKLSLSTLIQTHNVLVDLNHKNYNKILKSDWLSTVLISALIKNDSCMNHVY